MAQIPAASRFALKAATSTGSRRSLRKTKRDTRVFHFLCTQAVSPLARHLARRALRDHGDDNWWPPRRIICKTPLQTTVRSALKLASHLRALGCDCHRNCSPRDYHPDVETSEQPQSHVALQERLVARSLSHVWQFQRSASPQQWSVIGSSSKHRQRHDEAPHHRRPQVAWQPSSPPHPARTPAYPRHHSERSEQCRASAGRRRQRSLRAR